MRKLLYGLVGVMVLAYAAKSEAAGTGAVDKVSGWYAAGSNLTVNALPGLNSEFDGWSSDTNDTFITGAQINFTVSRPRSLTAEFSLIDYTLMYLAGANGSISGTATQVVEYGESGVGVTAVPATGYHFVDWSDGVLTASRTDTGVTNNITVTANFDINEYTVKYLAGAGGSITGTQTQTVAHGSSATVVTAVPGEGYHFVDWSDNVLTASRTDLNVTNDITVTASFAKYQYAFTVNSSHGAPDPAVGTTNIEHGTVVNFSMPVSEIVEGVTTQYVASGWVSDGSLASSATGTNGSFTITNATTMTWTWNTNYWVEFNVSGN